MIHTAPDSTANINAQSTGKPLGIKILAITDSARLKKSQCFSIAVIYAALKLRTKPFGIVLIDSS